MRTFSLALLFTLLLASSAAGTPIPVEITSGTGTGNTLGTVLRNLTAGGVSIPVLHADGVLFNDTTPGNMVIWTAPLIGGYYNTFGGEATVDGTHYLSNLPAARFYMGGYMLLATNPFLAPATGLAAHIDVPFHLSGSMWGAVGSETAPRVFDLLVSGQGMMTFDLFRNSDTGQWYPTGGLEAMDFSAPVPEPATGMLLALGLIVLTASRTALGPWRRRPARRAR
jgi:hypothetical protein